MYFRFIPTNYIGPVVEEEVKSQLISVTHIIIANLCHLDAFILSFLFYFLSYSSMPSGWLCFTNIEGCFTKGLVSRDTQK